MNEELRKTLENLPDKPGCYIMRDRNGRIIYVGKAVSLRRRVQSYFRPSTAAKANPKLKSLIHSVESLELMVVRNEAEALLTEGRLIKEYKPRYNVVFRDDKRYLALKAEHPLGMPKFSACRIVREDANEYFGPFPSSTVVHTVKDFLEKRYGIRKCSDRLPDDVTYKHCHNDVIAHCAAPCVGKCSVGEYRARFEKACAFMRGENVSEVTSGLHDEMQAASASRDFEKAAALRDTLFAIRDMVRQRASVRATPEMTKADAESGIEGLAARLGLSRPPRHIEGFDISHIGGTLTVASMVVSIDGRPAKSRYRHFRIRTVEGADDPASIAEVVRRRYARVLEEGGEIPDLVMIDGGITQLRAARAELLALGLSGVASVGLAKRFEEIVVDRQGEESVILPHDSAALQVLIRLRDEAHRFAITYNRGLRAKKIRESVLDEIEGIGPQRKMLLLRRFGSVARIAKASVEDIAAVGGIGPELAGIILAELAPDHSLNSYNSNNLSNPEGTL